MDFNSEWGSTSARIKFGSSSQANSASSGFFQQGPVNVSAGRFGFEFDNPKSAFSNPSNQATTASRIGFGSNSSSTPSFSSGTLQSRSAETPASTWGSLFDTPASINDAQISETNDAQQTCCCTTCGKRKKLTDILRCTICQLIHHADCTASTSCFLSLREADLAHLKLEVCNDCHYLHHSTSPNSCDSTQTSSVSPKKRPKDEKDAVPELRRSLRDTSKIPLCLKPDPVRITAEHFTTESTDWWLDVVTHSIPLEAEDTPIEPLFNVDDPIVPIALPSNHSDCRNPYKVTGRYFNSASNTGDTSDEDDNVDEDRSNSHNTTKIDEAEQDCIHALFGKRGWFYKLDRTPGEDMSVTPNAIWWHEDRLRLELGDDSSDEEDECKEDGTMDGAKASDEMEGHSEGTGSRQYQATVEDIPED